MKHVDVPTIDFVAVELQEHEMDLAENQQGIVAKTLDWIADEDQELIHLGPEKLKEWKGIERTGIPATEEW